jgi:O-antigen/teichoic acid export membrane protein
MNEDPQSPAHGIGTHTARGMVWAYGSYVGGRLLVLASTAVLARILTPDDFGLVALALTFMALLEAVKDLGLSQALVVQKPEELEERANTVFLAGVALGLLLSAIIAAISPLAERFFDQPELRGITAALGCNFFLRSLGATHYALAQKRLDFRTRTVAEFADVVVRGSVGIALAIAGLGAWALVIGYLAGTFTLDCVLWILVRWRPRLRAGFRHLREMTRFGATLSGVDITNAIMSNVDYLFVGKVLGPVALGLYTLAYRLPELLMINLSVVASNVLFPAFTAVDRDSLGRAFLISLRFTLMISLPIAVGMVILAKPIVLTLFGSQWADSAGAMRVLAIFGFAVSTSIPAGTAYKATGRAGVLLWLAAARLTLLITALAIFVDQGIVAAAACQAGVAFLFEGAGFIVASRLLALPVTRILAVGIPSAVGAAAMAIPLLALDLLIGSSVATVLAGIVVGGAVYLLVITLLDAESIRYLRDRILARGPQAPEPEPLAVTHETDVIA